MGSVWTGARWLFCLGLLLHGSAAWSAEPVRVVGLTSAYYDALLGCSLPGVVSEIPVKEGAAVKEGDVLIVFHRETEELEVARRRLILEDRSQLTGTEYRLETVRRDAKATRQLFESSRSVRRDELEKKELELKLVEAAVAQAKIAEKREELEFRMAQEQLRLRQIEAPESGTVVVVVPERGEYVQQNQPLIRLVNVDRCYLICNVEASLAHRFALGQTLPIEFEVADAQVTLQGEVTFVSALVDPASGLKEIKLVFDNPGHGVSPGTQGTLVLR
jgi:multidrug efflux system membrane fusion protein